jgi:hypothetical protein
MNERIRIALLATLIASVIGTAAWFSGLANTVWPAHPIMAVLLLTVLTEVVVKQAWPRSAPSAKSPASQV